MRLRRCFDTSGPTGLNVLPGVAHEGDQIAERVAKGGDYGVNAASEPIRHQRGVIAVGHFRPQAWIAVKIRRLRQVFEQTRFCNSATRAESQKCGCEGAVLAQQQETRAAAPGSDGSESAAVLHARAAGQIESAANTVLQICEETVMVARGFDTGKISALVLIVISED